MKFWIQHSNTFRLGIAVSREELTPMGYDGVSWVIGFGITFWRAGVSFWFPSKGEK